MEKYYKERFEARSQLDEKIVPLVKINHILQEMRDELLTIERNTRYSLASRLTAEGYSVCQAETAGAGLDAL